MGAKGRVPSCPSTFLFSASSVKKKKVQYCKKKDINMFGGFGKNQFVLVRLFLSEKQNKFKRYVCYIDHES